jgi:peptide deformylase
MTTLQMRILGDPILRERAEDVRKVSAKTKTLIADMFETMYAYHGVGLAANQVGLLQRVVVIDIRNGEPLAMVNPVITKRSSEGGLGDEGCLSMPGVVMPVMRAKQITVEYRDEKGRFQKLAAHGLLARAIQHEVDHLDGKLFVDHVDDKQKVASALKDMLTTLAGKQAGRK